MRAQMGERLRQEGPVRGPKAPRDLRQSISQAGGVAVVAAGGGRDEDGARDQRERCQSCSYGTIGCRAPGPRAGCGFGWTTCARP